MAKKKNYLSNVELRDEILKCISDGFDNFCHLAHNYSGASA